MNAEKAYSDAINIYELTNSLDEALAVIDKRRSVNFPVLSKEHLDRVEFHVRQFWSAGIKWKVLKTAVKA